MKMMASFLPVLLLVGCDSEKPSTWSHPITVPSLTNHGPTLSQSQVMELFLSRATTAEIQEFKRLAEATNAVNDGKAMQLVLYKLTAPELLQIGINEIKGQKEGELWWEFAVCRGFTDTNGVFEQTLRNAGIDTWGTLSHGYFSSFVLREQFYAARHVVMQTTNLHAVDLRTIEPKFVLQESL